MTDVLVTDSTCHIILSVDGKWRGSGGECTYTHGEVGDSIGSKRILPKAWYRTLPKSGSFENISRSGS